MEKSVLDYTPEELKEFEEKVDKLINYLDDFLKDIKGTIAEMGL